MEIEINIGREVTGKNDLIVPAEFTKVSRDHAVVHWKDGVMSIEDKDTPNGTFVNGRRVVRKNLKEDSVVWLGGDDESPECYQLDVRGLFEKCRMEADKARTDYSKEFAELKQIYIDYQTEVTKLKNQQNVKMRIVNYVPMIAGTLFSLIPISTNDPSSKLPLIIRGLGIVIGVVVTLVLLSRSTKKDISGELAKIKVKYEDLYICPKCRRRIPLTTHWVELEAKGKCPYQDCDAQFVVQKSE